MVDVGGLKNTLQMLTMVLVLAKQKGEDKNGNKNKHGKQIRCPRKKGYFIRGCNRGLIRNLQGE